MVNSAGKGASGVFASDRDDQVRQRRDTGIRLLESVLWKDFPARPSTSSDLPFLSQVCISTATGLHARRGKPIRRGLGIDMVLSSNGVLGRPDMC